MTQHHELAMAFTGFIVADELRRGYGRMLDVALSRSETPYRIALERPGIKLRCYGDQRGGPVLLIIPAPIKKPYIWDLTPRVSVVRRCLEADLAVYVVEWTETQPDGSEIGLSTYTDRLILECLDAIGEPVHLAGHSLGGTFAAIFASLHSDRLRGLLLLEAPLAFHQDSGAITALIRNTSSTDALRQLGDCPGTVLNALSLTASPESFLWWRWRDAIESMANGDALRTHLLVERWTLDELAMPAGVLAEVVELYQKDGFMRGTLAVGQEIAAARNITVPVLAVVDPESDLVPPSSVLPFLDVIQSTDKTVLHSEADVGTCLRHVGVLVGETAHRKLWPQILAWIRARR